MVDKIRFNPHLSSGPAAIGQPEKKASGRELQLTGRLLGYRKSRDQDGAVVVLEVQVPSGNKDIIKEAAGNDVQITLKY